MSYRCQNPKCNEVYYGPVLNVVTAVREVDYKKHLLKTQFNRDTKTKDEKKVYIDSSKGIEVVKEHKYCPECYALFKDIKPLVKETKVVNFVLQPQKDNLFTKTREDKQQSPREGKYKSFRDAFNGGHKKNYDEDYEEKYN